MVCQYYCVRAGAPFLVTKHSPSDGVESLEREYQGPPALLFLALLPPILLPPRPQFLFISALLPSLPTWPTSPRPLVSCAATGRSLFVTFVPSTFFPETRGCHEATRGCHEAARGCHPPSVEPPVPTDDVERLLHGLLAMPLPVGVATVPLPVGVATVPLPVGVARLQRPALHPSAGEGGLARTRVKRPVATHPPL